MITTKEWGALKRDTSNLGTRPARGIVAHHTASNPRTPLADPAKELAFAKRFARSIQKDHIARGWLDSGHHFLCLRSGLILEGRTGSWEAAQKGRVIQGAHAGDDEANANLWGVENEGNTNEAPLTPEQWAALVGLCAWLAFHGQFQSQQIYPHSNFRATACPGRLLLAQMPKLRSEVHDAKLALMENDE